MNQVISWVQDFIVRLLLTIFWVVIALFISAGIGYWNPLVAQAESLTQEVSSYQVDRTDAKEGRDTVPKPNNDLIEVSRQKLKSRADNVREKLNLEQLTYPDTDELLEPVKDRAGEAIKGRDFRKGW